MKRLTAEKRETRASQLSFRVVNSGMFFSIISLVVACLVPAQVMAVTFYVNGSCSINGNGTGATCAASSGGAGAWNSLKAASYCDRMNPGDVMEVRGGTYREDVWQPRSGCSGTPGNNVIIQNYAGEEVILDGTRDISGSTWTSRGNGVYECTSGTCGTSSKFPFTAWYDTGSGEKRLNLIQTNRGCDSTLAVGYMRYTTGGKVCAHLSDGSNPANGNYFRIPITRGAIQLNNNGTDYMTFRKNPSGGSFTLQRFRDHGIIMTTTDVGIYVDGLDIGWMMDRGINIDVSPIRAAGYKVTNNTLHHIGQEAIRFAYDDSTDSLIDGNTIYAVQTEPLFERCRGNCLHGFADNGTAIRAAELTNTQITNNTISDFGGGMNCRSYAIDLENGCKDCVVDSNYIYDAYKPDCTSPNAPQAIIFQSNTATSYDGTVVSNNRIHNVNVCFSTDPQPGAAGVTDIINNTCSEPAQYGFEKQDGQLGTWNIRNNIFTAENRTPTQLIYNNTHTGMSAENNSFYCPTCSGNIISWMGSTYRRAGDCTPGRNCVEDFDVNSVYGDPNLVATGIAPSLRLQTTISAAYGGGLAGSCPTTDFEGDSRGPGANCDIGADEFGEGEMAIPSPPTNVRVLQ